MNTSPSEGSVPVLLAIAVAIGVLVVGIVNGAFWLLADVNFDMKSYTSIFTAQVAIVSAPFLVMALLRIGSKAPWTLGIAMTLSLWGYYLYDGLRDKGEDKGANIGLGLIIMISPVVFLVICLLAAKLRDDRTVSSRDSH